MTRALRRKLAHSGILVACLALAIGGALAFIKLTQKPAAPKVPAVSHSTAKNQSKTTPPSASAPASKVLFFDALNGPDRIVTNEFVHYNPDAGCPYTSDNWDMTSGTLLIKNQAGYSGVPTDESDSICDSAAQNDSAIFRLVTKPNNFGDTTTAMDFMLVQHGGGGAPDNDFDGLHMWVRYQSPYALYVVTVSRWDGVVVIKKKVPLDVANCDDPSDDGCYYDLSPEIKPGNLVRTGVWHHAVVTANDDSNGVVHLALSIDGQQILTAEDNSVHGPVYAAGAAGVRGDNTEFYFKNFTISSL